MNEPAGQQFGETDEVSRLRDRIARLERAEQEREILSRLTARVAAATSATSLMDALCEESDRLLHWDCCYLVRRSLGKTAMHVVCYIDTEGGRKRVFPGEDVTPADTGPALRRALDGEALLFNRDSGEPVPPMVPIGTNCPAASLLFAPVRCGDTIIGVLSIQSYTPARYGRADLECLQRIAEVVALALERVYAEDGLRQSEARYRALVEQIPAITYTAAIDRASTTAYVSPQVATMLGYPVAEYTAEPDLWRKHLHPDDRERVMAEVARCQATGTALACEYRMVTRDGRVVSFRDEATIVRDERGQPVCLQGVMFDITGRKRADELLRFQRDLAVSLSSATTLSDALQLVLEAVLTLDGIDCAGIYLTDEATGDFRLIAHAGLSAAFVEAVSHLAPDSPQARRVASGKPIYTAAGHLADSHAACGPEGLQAIAILPVLYEGRVSGALHVASRRHRDLPPAARPTLESIAAQIGGAIARVRSREALQRARDELDRRVEERTSELRAANETLERESAEREKAEAALRERELLIRTVSNNLRFGMMYQVIRENDGSRRFTYLSDAVRRLYGVTPEAAMADPGLIYDRIHEEDRGRVWREGEEAHRTCSVFRTEVRMHDPSGGVRWSSFVSTPRRLEDGTTCWDGIEFDITDRKRAEAALRESEERFSQIAENSPAVVWLSNPSDDEILYINPTYEQTWGRSRESLRGAPRSWSDAIHPEDRDKAVAAIRARHSRGEAASVEYRVVRPDGSVRWIHDRSFPIRNEAGEVYRMAGIATDITARKEGEESLRQERDKAQNYLDVAGVMLLGIDATQRITLINKKGCEVLQCTEDEVLGTNWFDTFVPDSDKRRTKAAFAKLIAGQIKAVEYFENPVLNRAGESRLIAWHNTLLRDATGEIVGTLSSGEDITDRRRAEEERQRLIAQLHEAQTLEAVGRFGRGVAHDFNNLMAPVLGLASNMKAKRQPTHPDHAKLTLIEDAAETAARLAHQLLDFAKGGTIRLRLLSFGDVVKSALALVPPTAPQNVSLHRHIAPRLWRVRCDQTQMQQVVANLCRNALEAMPKGGRLTIKAENVALPSPLNDAQPPLATGEYVCLNVEDTGCGMDVKTMKRIFDPFFTTKERGHGLGLAAAYGIMAAHGGAISVTSAPGKGSTFRLWLPRAKGSAKKSASRKG